MIKTLGKMMTILLCILVILLMVLSIKIIQLTKKNKKSEIDIEQYKLLSEKNELLAKNKTKYLASMSHEIRTPLNGILVATDLLREHKLEERETELVTIISNSGKLLLSVINDILDHSKIEAGKLNLDYQEFALKDLLSEIIFFFKPQFEQKNLYLHYSIDKNFQESIYSDQTRIKQIIYNILSNALKFTDAGGVNIKIYSENDLICINITDTGIGIKTDDIERLFESYTQTEGQSASIGGTGLGLAISKSLSELLGGDIEVKSTLGRGSSFIIKIKNNELPKISSQMTKSGPSEDMTKYQFDQLKILVADDNAMNRKVLELSLKKKSIKPDFAVNGQEVLDMAKIKSYDLILMDIQMPIMNGIEASEKLFEILPYSEMPLIYALSANAFKEDKDLCFNAGMSGFLAKPLQIEELDLALVAAHKRTFPNS